MISIEEYTPTFKSTWDDLVRASRNGVFLHLRDYMDYHSDRFTDASLIARDAKGRAIAALPACQRPDGVISSHAGLTFGGWLMTPRADAEAMLEVWDAAFALWREQGLRQLVYKPSPYIYHSYPAEEDLYALVRYGATVTGSVASVVDLREPLGFDMASRQSVRKAEKSGVTVTEDDAWEEYWTMLGERLRSRYDAAPVHSLDEILLLKSRFPDNIRLYTARLDGRLLAGVVVYISTRCAHSQYTASSEEGRTLRVIPLIYKYILDSLPTGVQYFDFGTSNEDGGREINLGLIRQKCGFGGRAVIYPIYKYVFEII